MNILFLGTPSFAVPILKKLHEEFGVRAVITQPDRPVGRNQVLTPPPVKILALELGIPTLQPETASEIPEMIRKSGDVNVDFLITAAYGEYLPGSVLQLPKKDALNVHPSLLPKYRGATPMQSALMNGDLKTGVSIIRMVKEMDAGPVFAVRALEIHPDEKYPELEKTCSEIGAELLIQVLKEYESILPIEQEEKEASHCSKITKEMGEVHWERDSAVLLKNKLRAFTPWPGVFTWFQGQKLNLLDFSPNSELQTPNSPGAVFQQDEGVFIRCASGSIELHTVQLAGKNPCSIRDFLNGQKKLIGSILPSSTS